MKIQGLFNLLSCSTDQDRRRIRSLSSYLPAVYLGQLLVLGGSSQAGLHCARRMTTVSSWAFREQEGRLAALSQHLSEFVPPPRKAACLASPCAQLSHPPKPTGTPRRAISPSEGLLRPRVARAQEANRSFLSRISFPPHLHFLSGREGRFLTARIEGPLSEVGPLRANGTSLPARPSLY